MKKTTLLFAFLFAMQLFSQEILLDKSIKLSRSLFKENRETFPIVNKVKNETALFLIDNDEISGLLLDKNFKQIDSITTNNPASKYKDIIGHSIDDKNYNIFFTNDKKTKFFVKSIDFATKMSQDEELDFKFENDLYLQSISYNNKFYIISVDKKTSIINFYIFEGNKLNLTKKFDFTNYQFSDTSESNLYDIFKKLSVPNQGQVLSFNNPYALGVGAFKTTISKANLELNKLDTENLNSLESTSATNKIYYYDNKFYITLDNDINSTKIITIDLIDFKTKVNYFNHLAIQNENEKIHSNSYLYQNLLYQINTSKSELCYSIIDINNKQLLKSYRFKKDDINVIKNTAFVKEGHDLSLSRIITSSDSGILNSTILKQKKDEPEVEIDDAQKFLKRVYNSEIAITAHKSKVGIQLIVGGVKITENTTFTKSPTAFPNPTTHTFTNPVNGMTTNFTTSYYNPVMYNYNSYKTSRDTYFKTIIDQNNFEHIAGDLTKNAFDKIKQFENDNETSVAMTTVFKFGTFYVYGAYSKSDKTYSLRKFED